MKRWLKLLFHNAIIHPLMPFLPERVAVRMHDRNAAWAYEGETRGSGDINPVVGRLVHHDGETGIATVRIDGGSVAKGAMVTLEGNEDESTD